MTHEVSYSSRSSPRIEAAYRNDSLPKLRYIHLADTDFGGSVPAFISPVNMVLDYVTERHKRNAEVQVLRLENCYSILSKDVERFKNFVVDVIQE